jgi:soluble lytic murein transglycosylase-like protein
LQSSGIVVNYWKFNSPQGEAMKLSERAPILVLAWYCLVQSVWLYIYAFRTCDGAGGIADVRPESHYVSMIPQQREAALAAPVVNPPSKFAYKIQYDQIVAEVARTYGLDSALLHAVISVESSYISNAVSRKGAAGLMQLMPDTAKRYDVANPLDPVQNLHGGARYLRDLMKTFNNDVNLTLAAYNAGKSAVVKHGNSIPPFRETMNYVPRVLAFYRRYQSEQI